MGFCGVRAISADGLPEKRGRLAPGIKVCLSGRGRGWISPSPAQYLCLATQAIFSAAKEICDLFGFEVAPGEVARVADVVEAVDLGRIGRCRSVDVGDAYTVDRQACDVPGVDIGTQCAGLPAEGAGPVMGEGRRDGGGYRATGRAGASLGGVRVGVALGPVGVLVRVGVRVGVLVGPTGVRVGVDVAPVPPPATETEKPLEPRPAPPTQGSKPASTSIRYQLLLM